MTRALCEGGGARALCPRSPQKRLPFRAAPHPQGCSPRWPRGSWHPPSRLFPRAFPPQDCCAWRPWGSNLALGTPLPFCVGGWALQITAGAPQVHLAVPWVWFSPTSLSHPGAPPGTPSPSPGGGRLWGLALSELTVQFWNQHSTHSPPRLFSIINRRCFYNQEKSMFLQNN